MNYNRSKTHFAEVASLEITIRRWKRMEDFKNFFPLLREMLGSVYGSEEKGIKIYAQKYNAINYYKNYKAKSNSFLLVAELKGQPVGFLYARKRKDHTYLYDIFVEKELRGKGVGKMLIAELEKISGIPIRADTHSKALDFFRKLGFKILKTYQEDGVDWFLVEKG